MNNTVELTSVIKTYRSGAEQVCALNNVSLAFSPQDYVSVVGPSGAGKSTLLHVMGGLEVPTQGKVTFGGREIYRMRDRELSLWRNRTVGFMFQFYHLIEQLNVLENVVLAVFGRRRKSSFKAAEELLESLEIAHRKRFFPSQLSGGERQKVALARALINEPEIILCDEPTGNLDRDSQEKVILMLERLNREKKKTIVLVTHNPELARRAKKILYIEAGEIVKVSHKG